MHQIDNIDNRLRLLADWLKDSESNVDSYYDGHLESAIKYAKAETKQEIGQYIEEILNMPSEVIQEELIKKTKQ
jgi:hypothetical protein